MARHTPGVPVWQRNYYEHIVRDEEDWLRICAYIQANPLQLAVGRGKPFEDPISAPLFLKIQVDWNRRD